MAFTGRPALEAVDENRAAKALDGLALTPTPAVQQEVSQDPFTGSRKDAESPTRVTQHAGCSRVVFMGEGLPRWRPPRTPLLSALQHALNPERTDFDAELRRAWLRLGIPAEVKAAVESRISSRRRRGLPLTPLTYDGVTRSSILVNYNFY